jgi:hypothetical protein
MVKKLSEEKLKKEGFVCSCTVYDFFEARNAHEAARKFSRRYGAPTKRVTVQTEKAFKRTSLGRMVLKRASSTQNRTREGER